MPTALGKAHAAERIITVDGCSMNCAFKIVERAGFTRERIANRVQDCGLHKSPPLQYGDAEPDVAVKAIGEAMGIAG